MTDPVTQEQTPEQKQIDEQAKVNSYQKRKEELDRISQEAKKNAEERDRLARELEEFKNAKLQEQNNFKVLWESEKQKREAAEQEKKKLEKSFVNTVKRAAVHREAMAAGIREEALQDLDLLSFENVAIETTSTGHINVLGSKEYIESLKNDRKHWFKDSTIPNLNTHGGTSPQDKVYSDTELLKLEKENPEAYKKYMKKKYGLS